MAFCLVRNEDKVLQSFLFKISALNPFSLYRIGIPNTTISSLLVLDGTFELRVKVK